MLEINVKYRNNEFALDAQLSLMEKGLICILGPSGCGKTTLMRCIAGLEKTQKAHIEIDGIIWQSDEIFIPVYQRKIGMVFQDARLFPHLSVQDNLLYGFSRTAEIERKISLDEVVKILAIENLLNRFPHQISGGQAQRVAIGRALLRSPDLLLLDEPLSSLDFKVKEQIIGFLNEIKNRLNIPILYVTHSLYEADVLADYLVYMENGKIIDAGNPKKILKKLQLKTPAFQD